MGEDIVTKVPVCISYAIICETAGQFDRRYALSRYS